MKPEPFKSSVIVRALAALARKGGPNAELAQMALREFDRMRIELSLTKRALKAEKRAALYGMTDMA